MKQLSDNYWRDWVPADGAVFRDPKTGKVFDADGFMDACFKIHRAQVSIISTIHITQ